VVLDLPDPDVYVQHIQTALNNLPLHQNSFKQCVSDYTARLADEIKIIRIWSYYCVKFTTITFGEILLNSMQAEMHQIQKNVTALFNKSYIIIIQGF